MPAHNESYVQAHMEASNMLLLPHYSICYYTPCFNFLYKLTLHGFIKPRLLTAAHKIFIRPLLNDSLLNDYPRDRHCLKMPKDFPMLSKTSLPSQFPTLRCCNRVGTSSNMMTKMMNVEELNKSMNVHTRRARSNSR